MNRFYAPDHSATAQLLTDLAENLAAPGGGRVGGAGKREIQPVTIITSRLRYDDPKATPPPRETRNGVTIRRVWTTRFGRAGLWGRAVDYATFYLSAFIALLADARRGDTILAKTDPPLLSIPAAIAARLKGARLVNWCQDLFPETAAALGLRWAAGPFGRLLRRLRNWSLRQAECNIVLCDSMLTYLESEGLQHKGLRVIHNWPDPAIRPLPRDRAPGEPFTICYSGNLGRAHNVDSVIELIERTREIPRLRWRFVGGGAGTTKLASHVREHGIANVGFEPYAPKYRLAESLADCDAHLIALDPACEGLIQPSKLYGILAAGRPALILGSPEGSVARLLHRHAAGITLAADRPATWRPAIEALIADPVRLAEMSSNARRAYERRYTRDVALAAWREVLLPAEAIAPADVESKRSSRTKARAAA